MCAIARVLTLRCVAGPYGSPKLLQLSGVGPAALLAERGVPLVADLPVGAYAQGRPVVNLVHAYSHRKPLAPENNPWVFKSPWARLRWEAGMGGALGIGIAGTDGLLAPPADALTITTDHTPMIANGLRLKLAGCLINPESRAKVRIRSRDPYESVHVDTNLLATAADRNRAAACLMRLREVSKFWDEDFDLKEVLPGVFGLADFFHAPVDKQLALATANVRRCREGDCRAAAATSLPCSCLSPCTFEGQAQRRGLSATHWADTAALRDFKGLRKLAAGALQGYHFVGGCAVGSVLDGNLAVRGITGLRVVDSSAIPTIPDNSGPASSVYMLAEFAAERIIALNGNL